MSEWDLVLEALRPPLRPDRIRWITVPLSGPGPLARPEVLLRLDPAEPAFFWDADPPRPDARDGGPAMGGPSGPSVDSADSSDLAPIVGWGAAHVVRAGGPDRFDAVRSAADRLWPRIEAVPAGGAEAVPPRLFGGFSFLPSSPPAPWRAFGAATFVLPRLVYVPVPAGTGAPAGPRLAVAVLAADVDEPGRLQALVRRVLTLLVDGRTNGARPPSPVETGDAPPPEAWERAVASIRRRIRSGGAEKIVAARKREIRFDGGVDPVGVLRALGADTAAEARFAFRHGAATFLGATPERLISRRGPAVATEALAGSAGAERAPELLDNPKDAAEHAYVVRAIARALEPLCDSLEYPATPGIRRLRHVVHLRTPFTGRLSSPVHVLELVRRLHPTPAVGGTPGEAALEWIAANEPWSRGWYASPVGWFDAQGDGDFVVALRSALLDGARAHLYAGAGIVRDSEPGAELAETEVKLRTVSEALRGPS